MSDLNDLPRGCKAYITKIDIEDNMRKRLQDIGMIEGTCVECVGRSPLGDPIAFSVRGAVMALRCEVCSKIYIG